MLADFCMSPSSGATTLFANDCFGSVVPYYTACGSTASPYATDYSQAYNAAMWLKEILNPRAYAATANQLSLLGSSDKCLRATNQQVRPSVFNCLSSPPLRDNILIYIWGFL